MCHGDSPGTYFVLLVMKCNHNLCLLQASFAPEKIETVSYTITFVYR